MPTTGVTIYCDCGWQWYSSDEAIVNRAYAEHKPQCPSPGPELSSEEAATLLLSLAREVTDEYGGTLIVRKDR